MQEPQLYRVLMSIMRFAGWLGALIGIVVFVTCLYSKPNFGIYLLIFMKIPGALTIIAGLAAKFLYKPVTDMPGNLPIAELDRAVIFAMQEGKKRKLAIVLLASQILMITGIGYLLFTTASTLYLIFTNAI
jgi:hypothetical protein